MQSRQRFTIPEGTGNIPVRQPGAALRGFLGGQLVVYGGCARFYRLLRRNCFRRGAAVVGGEIFFVQDREDLRDVYAAVQEYVGIGRVVETAVGGGKGFIGKLRNMFRVAAGNKAVAAVTSKGKVTAKAAGTTTIQATVGGKSVSCKLTVKQK